MIENGLDPSAFESIGSFILALVDLASTRLSVSPALGEVSRRVVEVSPAIEAKEERREVVITKEEIEELTKLEEECPSPDEDWFGFIQHNPWGKILSERREEDEGGDKRE